MQPIKHALVLTGEVLPGFNAATVWPALAAYFRMEPDRLKAELLARAPISIKESDDLAKLQKLQDGASAVGAATDLQAISGDNLFVLVDGVPRGPVPHAYVEDRVRSGAWPSSISIAVVGSSDWKPFIVPTSPATDLDQQATVAFSTLRAENTAPSAAAAAVDMRMAAAAPAAAAVSSSAAVGDPLPEGGIVHAGFWRRCAAYVLDSIILTIPFLLVFGALGYMSFRSMMSGEAPGGMIFLLYFLAYIGAIVGSWLYFAKFESGVNQATPGKRIMGLKVTNANAERISFGRATGRFFGKIVTGIIPFGIGWMMAGFTGRKQALHDMMASTCVVFREVSPGKPLPSARPPMPWYGWALNIFLFVSFIGGMIGYAYFITKMVGLAAQQSSTSISDDFSQSSSDSSVVQDSDSSDDSDDMDSSSSGVDDGDKATIRAGLTDVFMVASATQTEVASIADGGGDCPTEERTSANSWIESIQLGGLSPECTVTIRLSSSSDIPFAARIERVEWIYAGSGNWRCESSMASDLLPFTCN